MDTYWLKPIMILLAVFAFIYLLMNLDQVFPDVQWSTINENIVEFLPLIVILIFCPLFLLMYIRRKR